jgi:hypothetical protein
VRFWPVDRRKSSRILPAEVVDRFVDTYQLDELIDDPLALWLQLRTSMPCKGSRIRRSIELE